MADLKTFLGVLSGLGFLRDDLPLETLLPTMFVVNVCDAVMCRLFAHNNGYPKNLWTAIGLVFGLWGVMLLIVIPKRERRMVAAEEAVDRSSRSASISRKSIACATRSSAP